VDPADRLLQLGLLDVTKAPYRADATGVADSTKAIQRAVNDARDHALVCFFPEGTYLISDRISCEQKVAKIEKPAHPEGIHTAHYMDVKQRILLFGSGKGKRPVLKLAKNAKGFDDPEHPKIALWIWAQTRNDAPGKQEPIWGQEQPNISMGHVLKGIDIDVSGHPGAIGIRHSGSQRSTLMDCTVHAEGAYAGMNNCPGQGGGTHNVEVIGGRYGIIIEPDSRFPLLAGCVFKGQTEACVTYAKKGSQVPTLFVGCHFAPAGDTLVDFTTAPESAGVSIIDSIIEMKPVGLIAKTKKTEGIYIEDTYVRGAEAVCSGGGKISPAEDWTLVRRYSTPAKNGVNLVNGVESTGEIAQWAPAPSSPSYEAIHARHYRAVPCVDEPGVVDVKSFGAKGDGAADDTQAFERAIAASDKVFVPKGSFRLSGTLQLRPNTQIFGLTYSRSTIGQGDEVAPRKKGKGKGASQPSSSTKAATSSSSNSFTLVTPDDADAAPSISFMSINGQVEWRCGKGDWRLVNNKAVHISGNGGGRFFGRGAMSQQLIFDGLTQPTSFYALNVEHVRLNPQSEIRNSKHLRFYYFKVEAGTIPGPNAPDKNTPCRIVNSEDVRIYCMYGNVRQLGDRPMLDVVNSDGVVVSQLKAFQPGSFPHVTETFGTAKHQISSSKIGSLFVRDNKPR
jgi:hypothetical protein